MHIRPQMLPDEEGDGDGAGASRLTENPPSDFVASSKADAEPGRGARAEAPEGLEQAGEKAEWGLGVEAPGSGGVAEEPRCRELFGACWGVEAVSSRDDPSRRRAKAEQHKRLLEGLYHTIDHMMRAERPLAKGGDPIR